jgi:hypothetical protein
MSFENKLNEDVQRGISSILNSAKTRADAIIASAQKTADTVNNDELRLTGRECRKRYDIAQSEYESVLRAETGRAFESFIDIIREDVFKLLIEYWQNDFLSIASKTLIFGAKAAETSEINVLFTPAVKDLFYRDETQIRSALNAENIMLRNVSFTLNAHGGAVIISIDGRRMWTDTFEECFRRIEDNIRIDCAQRIGYGNFA